MRKRFALLTVIALSACVFSLGKQETEKHLLLSNNLKAKTYTASVDSKADALEKGLEVNEKIAEEGMVLLKNENNALPLSSKKGTAAPKVTVFGYAAYNPAGGSSTSGDTSGGRVRLSADILSSLADSGIRVNPTVESTYKSWFKETKQGTTWYGTPTTVPKYASDSELTEVFTDSVKTSLEKTYADYGDAAILVFNAGSDAFTGTDAKRTHRMQLDPEQYDLVKYAESKFDKVIVLINNSVPIEIDKLKKDDKVDAILLVGEPGDNGFEAVGKILTGEVNPSGHLADTYAADFTKTPSYQNVSHLGTSTDNAQYVIDGKAVNTYFRDYDEGIYVGYRYYETAYAETEAGNYDGFDYDKEVSYPFGYGLSYTSFSWDVVSQPASTTLAKDGVLNFKVKVTNTGDVAGKDVVELYYHAPYTKGGIEKSDVVLGDFAKTDLLEPGQSEVLSLKVKVNDMASYDYKTDKTYVLDAGDYKISFRTDSHTIKKGNIEGLEIGTNLSYTYNLATKALVNTSSTGETVTNQFDDVSEGAHAHGADTFSRADFKGTFPEAVKDSEKTLTAEEFKAWAPTVDATYDTDKPWTATTMPKYADEATRPAKASVTLKDMVGLDYNDEKWDTLLDELSLDEMNKLISNAGFRTETIDYIGKPYSLDTDGPKGWTGTGTAGTPFNAFAAEPVIACTWSKDLAYEMGEAVGEQSLWGSSDRTDTAAGGKIYAYTGWYAPGMNIHRSPFDSRANEYFSEDPYLTGEMAANQSLGIKSKGGFVFIKHFALHEDGGGVGVSFNNGKMVVTGYRGGPEATSGTSYWVTEQALREIYLKPFQIAVEEGEAGAAMSSFSRFGSTWAGGSYALLTQVLRNEWGFKGYVVTDIDIYGFLNPEQMIRAGGDCLLTSGINSDNRSVMQSDYTKTPNATEVTAMRRASKAILYTVANSHAMDVPYGAKVLFDTEEETASVAANADISLKAEASLNTKYAYSTIKYESDDLPDGLTLDETTGAITGKVATAGEYVFHVTATADDYESATKKFTLNVTSTEKSAEQKAIDDLSSKVTQLETENSSLSGKVDTLTGKVDTLTSEIDELKNKNSGGCGGSVIAATSIVGALALLGTGLALKKKREDK